MWWARKGKDNPPYPDARSHIDQPARLLYALNAVGEYYREQGEGEK